MSRIRSIKPTLFIDDRLADCSPHARLLFIGLPCLADCEGRLEDRPRRIKVELLPYDDVDIETLLGELVSKGFIIRYEANGISCIQIVDFKENQQPHINEKKKGSKLPPPPDIPSTAPSSQSAFGNPHSAMPAPPSTAPSSQSAFRNPQSAMPAPPSTAVSPKSALRNPHSAIPTSPSTAVSPKSAIRNPHSAIPNPPHLSPTSTILEPDSSVPSTFQRALNDSINYQGGKYRQRLLRAR